MRSEMYNRSVRRKVLWVDTGRARAELGTTIANKMKGGTGDGLPGLQVEGGRKSYLV